MNAMQLDVHREIWREIIRATPKRRRRAGLARLEHAYRCLADRIRYEKKQTPYQVIVSVLKSCQDFDGRIPRELAIRAAQLPRLTTQPQRNRFADFALECVEIIREITVELS